MPPPQAKPLPSFCWIDCPLSQITVGDARWVAETASSDSNQASLASSITAPGPTGSTQAKSLGSPVYWT